jgi:hypothetical protein
LIEPLLEYRRSAGERVAGTDRSDEAQLAKQAETVESLLEALESAVCQPGFDESRAAVASLRAEWETIRRSLPQWSQAGEFGVYAEHAAGLLRPLRRLASAAALQGTEVQWLAVIVADVDDLSQMAFTIRHAARSHRFERETQGRISRLLGRLESRQSLLPETLRPSTRADLNQKVEQEILRDPVPIEPPTAATIGQLVGHTIQSELNHADELLARWSQRLDARVGEATRQALLTAMALVAALIAAVGAVYLVLRQGETVTPVVSEGGDSLNQPRPDDEIRRLASELADLADEAEVALENLAIRLASHDPRAAAEVDRCLDHWRRLHARIGHVHEVVDASDRIAPAASPQPS